MEKFIPKFFISLSTLGQKLVQLCVIKTVGTYLLYSLDNSCGTNFFTFFFINMAQMDQNCEYLEIDIKLCF